MKNPTLQKSADVPPITERYAFALLRTELVEMQLKWLALP
jgi:hypothetical protein